MTVSFVLDSVRGDIDATVSTAEQKCVYEEMKFARESDVCAWFFSCPFLVTQRQHCDTGFNVSVPM